MVQIYREQHHFENGSLLMGCESRISAGPRDQWGGRAPSLFSSPKLYFLLLYRNETLHTQYLDYSDVFREKIMSITLAGPIL